MDLAQNPPSNLAGITDGEQVGDGGLHHQLWETNTVDYGLGLRLADSLADATVDGPLGLLDELWGHYVADHCVAGGEKGNERKRRGLGEIGKRKRRERRGKGERG